MGAIIEGRPQRQTWHYLNDSDSDSAELCCAVL